MTPTLQAVLLALAVLCLGVAMLIEHRLINRVLALVGSIVAGAVLLVLLLR
jgi:hypothetical protein